MTSSTNPFLDPVHRHRLYGNAFRLAERSAALLKAKTAGRPVPETIAHLLTTNLSATDGRLDVVLDIGCGRGTSSRVLAENLAPRRLVGIDAAAALLDDARVRLGSLPGTRVDFIQADFHRLPLPDRSCTAAVAAFCLYHSPRPERAIEEIARVLVPGGVAVLVTKSLDSYREMDVLVATTGLDPHAERHESLYASAHSGNLDDLTSLAMDVTAVEHEQHRFTFADLDHVAEYLATNPKYDLAHGLYGNPRALATALHERHEDQPLTTGSVITYVVARPHGGPA